MNILNNIRVGVSLSLLVLAYGMVALSGVVLWVTDKVSGNKLSTCDYPKLWDMFKDEVDLVKQGLL